MHAYWAKDCARALSDARTKRRVRLLRNDCIIAIANVEWFSIAPPAKSFPRKRSSMLSANVIAQFAMRLVTTDVSISLTAITTKSSRGVKPKKIQVGVTRMI